MPLNHVFQFLVRPRFSFFAKQVQYRHVCIPQLAPLCFQLVKGRLTPNVDVMFRKTIWLRRLPEFRLVAKKDLRKWLEIQERLHFFAKDCGLNEAIKNNELGEDVIKRHHYHQVAKEV
jgi:hypothetical protein